MRKNLLQTAILLCAATFCSCQTPSVILSKDLHENTAVMTVKGRQGWQINQIIRFGNYTTSKVKRGWTSGYDISAFVLRFQKAREKLSFTQTAPDGSQAEVLAVGKFQNTEYELLRGFVGYSIRYENTFAGSIIPAGSEDNTWEFMVYNPEGSLSVTAECGMAKDKAGREILIRGIRQMDQQPKWMQFANYGFEFIQHGQSIGAVSTINNGKVWIRNDIDPDLKLVLSAMATSLLVRHNVSEAISNG